jgi:hypothetical protein
MAVVLAGRPEESGFDFRQGQEIFLLLTPSRAALVPSERLSQMALGVSLGKATSVKLISRD